ncbi:hypothetical protein CERSUDRAFT_91981 [Gelatoporia subvermispora B]|uniref:DUF6533 domain-containing protein n=1 Tax=Ceriporiopsis subvermispora (strain B) TaxID=914234 RepID=M2QQY4_CERS8|nr:hypothetical protein CERSUDRAFT_91981 [Gelatoporia subvermispora B]
MSQAFGSKAAEELVSNWESFWIQNCCVVAALALILYNHVSTFTSEVELMWRRSLNSVTLIFHLNRWVTLMWGMVTLMYYNFLPLHVAVSRSVLRPRRGMRVH